MARRPAALREVIGHAGTVLLLTRLVACGRLPHAMVLEGPAGCGRRTMALALASALLCPERIEGDACGVCAHCVQCVVGNHPDLSELPGSHEAPSGLPVEQARAVAEGAGSSPLLGVAKAIIIPEAERLRGASANALLKILEEPPPRTTLILTASSAASLLGTIRSRSQVYRMHALTMTEVAQVLERNGLAPARASALAAAGAGVRAGGSTAAPPAPIADLERILASFDLGAITRVISALPSKLDSGDEDDARTPAAVQRACLREWLVVLATQLRQGLRSSDPLKAATALDHLERIARARADLDRNHAPRLALESLSLGR